MPNLLAMSFEGELAPSFDLRCLAPGRKPPDGWGIGYYPGGEPSASILKEPAPPQGSIRSELIKAWEHLASSLFVLHIRTATWGQISDANTQPFLRSYGGRDWLFAHSGSLEHRVELPEPTLFTPVGSTDTEAIFCDILERFARRNWTSIGEADPNELREWLEAINKHGTLTIVLADGRDLCVYADQHATRDRGIFVNEIVPPYEEVIFADPDLGLDLTGRGVKSRKGVLISSSPLEREAGTEAKWQKLEPGHLITIRQGSIRAHAKPTGQASTLSHPPQIVPVELRLPRPAQIKRFTIRHRTSYHYDKPVERSTHLLRLTPYHDRMQRLIETAVTMSVNGQSREFEDVFGNHAQRVLIDTDYTDLIIEGRSTVEVLDTDPMHFGTLRTRSTIPLVWMPWQRQALQPYLLPPELPETELRELVEYAMSFVERNDYDLLDTLLDLNSTIFREYKYVQGATTHATTPFDVYTERRGVCQDFTNLFICLTRLLGVPARYTCGYVYTGPKHANQVQSEASHAWVQVYLPEVGWRGFDPTNGIITQTDHVRVAVGRNYVDATPTSGTIFVGGGTETLKVDVRVEPIEI
jgi:transglutaminase-like putative cysteine protease/predicted glutamine amidotransferase